MEIVLDGDQPRKFADRRLALRDEDATDHISITRIVAKAMHLKSLSISAADSKQTQLYDETTHDEIGRFWLYLLDQLAYALGTTQYYRGIRPESPGGRLVELDPKGESTVSQMPYAGVDHPLLRQAHHGPSNKRRGVFVDCLMGN